jgi:hypothetical protein
MVSQAWEAAEALVEPKRALERLGNERLQEGFVAPLHLSQERAALEGQGEALPVDRQGGLGRLPSA